MKTNVNTNHVSKYHYNGIYLIISLLSLIFMIINSPQGSMWYDEMFTVGHALENAVPNSSFITIEILQFYIRLIPIQQIYIYLLPEVGVALSIYFLGLIAKILKNGQTGIYACLIMGFSPYVIRQVGLEFRPYFMLLLLSCVVFYLFLLRFRYNNSIWMITVYGFANMMLMDCHEYGKVLVLYFVCIDILLIATRKLHWRNIISMSFVIIYGVYWLCCNDLGGLWNNYSWTTVPTPEIVYNTFCILLSNSIFFLALFILGIMLTLIEIKRELKKESIRLSKLLDILLGNGEFIALLMIVGVFSASIIYSVFINPENSLYVNRYFISVIAYMILFVAIGCNEVVTIVEKNIKTFKTIVVGLFIIVILNINLYYFISIPEEHNQLFRQSAEYMRYNEEAYLDGSMVYISDDRFVERAWTEYLDTDKELIIFNKYNLDLSKICYEKIYVVSPAYGPTNEQNDFLQEKYTLQMKVADLPIWIYVRK